MYTYSTEGFIVLAHKGLKTAVHLDATETDSYVQSLYQGLEKTQTSTGHRGHSKGEVLSFHAESSRVVYWDERG